MWKDNGIIDEDNYAFLAGLSTTEPLMIKKMILEEAKAHNKRLAMADIDFSKAYDSTERFAKDMSLRRMGFPEEGLDMWQHYDGTRNMRILTAYGLTRGIKPQCGAWGQGAEESPMGWLTFMSWMSEYIGKNTTDAYEYKINETDSVKLSKIIYADDATYFAKSIAGLQSIVTAVANFAMATGVIVKPTKSYWYSNMPGTDTINIQTCGEDGKYGLNNTCTSIMKRIKEDDYWKHLGNRQSTMVPLRKVLTQKSTSPSTNYALEHSQLTGSLKQSKRYYYLKSCTLPHMPI